MFLTVVHEMMFWEHSCFGVDLMQDLSSMSPSERHKYQTGLANLRAAEWDSFRYNFLAHSIRMTVLHEHEHIVQQIAINMFSERDRKTIRTTDLLDRLEWYFEIAFSA